MEERSNVKSLVGRPAPEDSLVMTDKDGSYTYSPVRKIHQADEKIITIYPNPAGKSVTVNGISGYKNLSITDMYGKKLIEQKIQKERETIDIGALANGIYLIQLNKEGHQKTLKLIKKD